MKNGFFALQTFLKKTKRPSESSRHAKKRWKNREAKISFSKTVLFFTLLFLFIPLIFIIIYSFNQRSSFYETFSNLV